MGLVWVRANGDGQEDKNLGGYAFVLDKSKLSFVSADEGTIGHDR